MYMKAHFLSPPLSTLFQQSSLLKIRRWQRYYTPVIPEILNFHHHRIGDEKILCTGLFCWTIRVVPWNRCSDSPVSIASHTSLLMVLKINFYWALPMCMCITTLLSCWIIHLSHLITELNIHHLHWINYLSTSTSDLCGKISNPKVVTPLSVNK